MLEKIDFFTEFYRFRYGTITMRLEDKELLISNYIFNIHKKYSHYKIKNKKFFFIEFNNETIKINAA